MPMDKKITESFNYKVGKEKHIAELPKYCWNPYRNIYPINYLNDQKIVVVGDKQNSEGTLKMEAFLLGDTNSSYNKNYIDIVIDPKKDKDMTFSNTVISYKYSNKDLKIKGLPIGEYIIQLYTVKKGHDGNYKVVTYEDYDLFTMDIPEISSEEFDKENNIYKIDFIKTNNSDEGLQVDLNFMTKMERKINLTTDNLRSNILPDFKVAEKNEETEEIEGIGETEKIKLKELTQKNFLFPLDIVFVIDNSGSMQRNIDIVKNKLTVFGQELYDRGFDVKYNLITFGPLQTSDRIGDWSKKIYSYHDNNYMAIYKERWFDGSTLENVNFENKKEKEKDELIDALNNIRSGLGYLHGQENSAWGLHYAIQKLRTNGRYLNYLGEITDNKNSGDIPSEKMIIFLTDENMDTRDKLGKNTLKVLGYNHDDVLKKLYAKLNSTHNGMADNINLTGLFHVKRKGNIARDTNIKLTRYRGEGVPNLGYKYSWGVNKDNRYWEEWDDRKTPIVGIAPIDTADIYHTDFKLYNTGNNFFMYEIGEEGENIKSALLESIDNLGIIQRWELSYLTPFNRYDGTTRTVDFKLIDILGVDKNDDFIPITKEIKNLDDPADNPNAKIEDRQYTVQEEKIVIKFKDPTITSPKLSIRNKRGVIKFLAKSRYYDTDSSGEDIIIEDLIKDCSLDVFQTDGTLLFNRNTDNIDMRLSEDGWYEFNVALTDAEMEILRGEKLGKDPIKYIDLEVTVANDLFTQTETLKDVEIDVTPPKITKIEVVDTTLREFLKTMIKNNKEKLFTDIEENNYSGYTVDNKSKFSSILNYSGSSVKTGDLIDIILIVEDKNLSKDDIYINIEKLVGKKPLIERVESITTNKFKVIWEKLKVDDISGIIKIKNTIEDKYGNIGDQNFGILNIDTTDIIPDISITDSDEVPIDLNLSDGKYYVNKDYNVKLSRVGDIYRAGIGAFKYNKTKADLDSNNNYYGDPTFYHCSPSGLYTGGVKETDIKVHVDDSHRTDGEYTGNIYEMNKSGKLIDINDYSENNFDRILDLNYDKFSLDKTTIVVDTIKPIISNVSIINKTFLDRFKVNSLGNDKVIYVKDKDQIEVSFDIKDFNISLQEIGKIDERGLLIKDGYLLEIIKDPSIIDSLVGTIKKSENTSLVDTYTVTYTFTINDPSLTEKVIEFNIKGRDKAGNQTTQKKIIILNNNKPKTIVLEVYEDIKDRNNITTQRNGDKNLSITYNEKNYKFTKGGGRSWIKNPMIYGKIGKTGGDIRYLKINKNENLDPLLDILGKTDKIEIGGSYNKFITDSMNMVIVTPISVSGVEGDRVEFRFIVDTRVNTSYLEGGIIGNLVDKEIKVDLSHLGELVGIDGYSYVFTIGGQIVDSGNSGNNSNGLNGSSFPTIQNKSIDDIINIDTSNFKGGSRGELIVIVWDRLGHEKIFEKTYFIPAESDKIISTVQGEKKQRESKVRIIGEGSDDKFKLESCIDSNLE